MRKHTATPRGLAAIALAVTTVMTTVSGVAAGEPAAGETELREASGRGLAANIRYTEYGIPHIKAANFAGLGYGYGFAAAKDNICVLADTYLTVDAQRSRYLGPDAPGNRAFGSARTSLSSDLYFQQVIDSGVVERALAEPPPAGPRAEVRDIIRGYVAGYNRYLRDTGVSGISDPACRDAEWVRPITEIDVYRHFYAVATISGQGQMIDGITSAAPPGPGQGSAGAEPAIPADIADRVRRAMGRQDMGSNAIAVGRDGTRNRKGLLLGNPHYPWHGGRRFWQSQMTVPGKLNVSGGSLLGLPLVQIGFNRDVAWSHTVATPRTFGLYQVDLVPGEPTTYLVDGRAERMTSRTVSVEVRGPDGSLDTVERTLYSTRYGPVLSPTRNLPLPWTETGAYTIRDANHGNLRGLNTWFELGRARSTREVQRVLARTQGVPWVNTVAADRQGHALYADVQVVPHVTDELARRCSTPLGSRIFPATGIPVLEGSRGECAWGNDPDALVPGIFGPSRMPVLNRTDYVANSNDSAWLSNPRQPITGYPRIMGDIGTERGPRTRMGITAVEQQLASGRFSRKDMQDLLFDDRSWAGTQAAADTARMCADFPSGKAPTSGGGTVEVGSACTALSEWDQRMAADSRGGLLFERYWLKIARLREKWRVPFDPADPVATPNTLNTGDPRVRQALGDAIAELRAAGIEPDAPLGENHYVVRNGDRIPVHGGHGDQGVLNMIVPTWDPEKGNTEVEHGSSHIQAVSFSRGHCPDAATLLTYSQSSDPSSPHYADQTRLFADGRWVRSRFCEWEIWTSPELRLVRLRER
ncbi:penicillin acylase family protein [Amycolatopsis cihanbeyliensis]|uniref:Acyl-homoserine-lactone acylase n=1 Tax=Amycolatopsis cihanbeyliensis TaxID=1128664 RepID=A0A542DQE1_AMYCI|nr:penicillin acylase family protein [Amycolatopsis cihanbeyliensis]TQJ05312.1 acyl-homoserine-lactone acylase [Amycolatopsis cihanbeyliensis]